MFWFPFAYPRIVLVFQEKKKLLFMGSFGFLGFASYSHHCDVLLYSLIGVVLHFCGSGQLCDDVSKFFDLNDLLKNKCLLAHTYDTSMYVFNVFSLFC